MLSSKDNNRNLMDVYVYDNLNRLTGVSGPGSMTMTYAANGNISSKTLVGNYTYGGSGPHAVTSVTNPGGLISTTTQRVTYTSFNKVDSIIQANLVYTVAYGKDDQRTISKLFDNGTLQKTVYYIGDYEKEVKPGNHTRQIHYISGGDGLTAIFVRNDGADTMYYVHPDYLGSLNVITNQSGSVVKTYCYDAWGRRRNPTDWTYSSIPSTFLFTRGYTGHEMLDQFSLINMNGRIYDPLLARFLNPDNFVQSPTSPQNYNRYSYCVNNPLKYTDPTGQTWWSHFKGWWGEHNIGETLFGFAAPEAGISLISSAIKGDWDITKPGSTFNNMSRIYLGAFAADTKQAGWGWQIVSRFTWEGIQSSMGLIAANQANIFWNADYVNYYAGATAISLHNKFGGAFTLGSYIMGGPTLRADPSNPYFQHEYGHYLQSRIYGFAYMTTFATPSLVSAWLDDGTSTSKWEHDYFDVEQDASQRALRFLRKRDPDYDDWNFSQNPILKESFKIHPGWMDYILSIPFFGASYVLSTNTINDGNRTYCENNYGLILNMSDYANFFE